MPDPYAALGYHPADADLSEKGTHGTHVASIAAGNGRAGGPLGVAPEANLIFVHLAARRAPEISSLGDSVRVLEGVDFVARTAGDRPWVINLSLGERGGPHDGTTLVEQALDEVLRSASGRAICQSTGNYFDLPVHAAGELRPGESRALTWRINQADTTPNELEVWYSGRDVFSVEMRSPAGDWSGSVQLGEQRSLIAAGREVGRIYHRPHDPNNLDHLIDVFLDPGAPAGSWDITLNGIDVGDGRFHAWVERDAACEHCDSWLGRGDVVQSSTTGTIANGFRTIAVGAYDPHSPEFRLAPFSSSGPTRDGRAKPNLVAPGVAILAAHSASQSPHDAHPAYVRKSGTSQAAPHVAGTVALMFEAAGRPLRIDETRSLLLSSCNPVARSPATDQRVGERPA